MKNFLVFMMMLIPFMGWTQDYKRVVSYCTHNMIQDEYDKWVRLKTKYERHEFMITPSKIYWVSNDDVYYNIVSVKKSSDRYVYLCAGKNDKPIVFSIENGKSLVVVWAEDDEGLDIKYALVFDIETF